MPITFDWDDGQQRVLRLVAADPWNWNDFHKTMRRATFLLDRVDHSVEIIVDLRQSVRLPAGALGHIRSLGVPLHPNMRNRLLIIGLDESIAGPLGGADGLYQDRKRLIRFVANDDETATVIDGWLADRG